ncbi:hypothetical protein PRIPAC_82039 [Pristionchus pacificus]|uniref:Uncharacterized protein n=1 Tax=Pristionchus pacificus TaxID=54126 RepID=A0A454XLE4_PRIPA|nr:hypothetical protein PRIPAC_82039 [Pristionchus pacificus]|eukprot:PDM78283.1 hypothetical protein PRIPAC_30862 [Pristionchus pacificus]
MSACATICSVYASRMMVKNKKGLIVNSDGVTCVSLWPGLVRTQLIMKKLDNEDFAQSPLGKNLPNAESIEYSGKAVVALVADPEKWRVSGRILTTVDLGDKYGFTDVDGRRPLSLRSASFVLRNLVGYDRLAEWLPNWIKVPGWMLAAWYSTL